MSQDVHRTWIAEVRTRMPELDPTALRTMRQDAEAARARAEAAGDPRGVVPLYLELLRDLDAQILGRESEALLASLDLATLARLLASADPELRIRALQRAEELALPGADRAVEALMDREPDLRVLASAAKALGVLGAGNGRPRLQALRGHGDPRVRANAVEGLWGSGVPAEDMIVWVDDPDPRVRGNLAVGLAGSYPETAKNLLRGLLLEGTPAGRKVALDLVVRLGSGILLDPFLEAVDPARPEVAGEILAVLGQIPDPRVVRLLVELMEDKAAPLAVRSKAMAAARSLEPRLDPEATGVELLKDVMRDYLRELSASDTPKAPAARPDEPDAESRTSAARMSGAERMKQKNRNAVKVVGKVLDATDRRPILRATVRVAQSGMMESTDNRGQFVLERLERGETYVLIVEKQGYPVRSIRYRCGPQNEQVVHILMTGGTGPKRP